MMVPQKTLRKESYAQLLIKIKSAVESSQKHIEQIKAMTYWKVGELISKHLLQNNGRAGYGQQLYKRLAQDLNIGQRTLERTVQFHRQFPIPSARTQLNWSHYRELAAVTDPALRNRLIRKAERRSLSTRQLAREIKKADEPAFSVKRLAVSPGPLTPKPSTLTAKKGPLNIYQAIKPSPVNLGPGEILLDLGFNVKARVRRGTVKDGQVVATRAKMSFTYRAYVEQVIDGDTLWVLVDLGFGNYTSQKLRLRGIDAPELSTKTGQEAKRFVQKTLQNMEHIVICSSKSDKYDRYLADIFIPLKPSLQEKAPAAPRPRRNVGGAGVTAEKYIFLNQELLDEGFATAYQE